MLKLNVIEIMEKNKMSKYELYNKLNQIRSINSGKLMNYTNFQNMILQKNKSVLYDDLDQLCEALNCNISDLLTRDTTNTEKMS